MIYGFQEAINFLLAALFHFSGWLPDADNCEHNKLPFEELPSKDEGQDCASFLVFAILAVSATTDER
jgi:hypothetical protein